MFEGILFLGLAGLAILGAYVWAKFTPMNEDENGKWTR